MQQSTTSPTTMPSRRKRTALIIVLVVGALWLMIGSGILGAWLGSSWQRSSQTRQQTPDGNLVAGGQVDVSAVAQKLSPSVVSIVTTQQQFTASGLRQRHSAGTGAIISSDGYILTNKHVVSGDRHITVIRHDGERHSDVRLVGVDPLNDIAFLKIEGVKDLPAVQLGDSGTVRIGQQVVAIGNSLGHYQNTVTTGIISGKGRPVNASLGRENGGGVETLTDLLQTDAAINPGNSGGPLINASGQVIGINTAIVSNAQSVGFAIPINAAKGLMRGVLETGTIKKAYLGIRYVAITPDVRAEHSLSAKQGAFVGGQRGGEAIQPGGPAADAGIREGDVIVKVNDKLVGQHGGLGSLVAEYLPGETVKLTVLRGDKQREVPLKLGEYRSQD